LLPLGAAARLSLSRTLSPLLVPALKSPKLPGWHCAEPRDVSATFSGAAKAAASLLSACVSWWLLPSPGVAHLGHVL
jgi:hypothetical protein